MHNPLAWLARHRRAAIGGAALVAIGAAALLPSAVSTVRGQICGTLICGITVPNPTVVTTTVSNPAPQTQAQPQTQAVPATVVNQATPASAPPAPPPPPAAARTAAAPPAPPAAAATVAGAGAGAGGGTAQTPKGVQLPARVALPNTGAGVGQSNGTTGLLLPLLAAAVLLAGAGAFALRRSAR